MRRSRIVAALGLLALSASCGSLPPLRGRIEVGKDPFVIFVGGSSAAGGDLYAVPAGGGLVIPITFTAVGEMRPSLAPDGGAVAFLRAGSLRDSTPASVWVMNLLSGRERRIALPRSAGPPDRVGWTRDGSALVVEARGGLYQAPPPPVGQSAQPVPDAERAAADSALAVLLGDPVFARVVRCAEPADLCVQGDTGTPGLLERGARGAARWGPDSVLLLLDGGLVVRPLGPGRARRVDWTDVPPAPRDPTAFGGPTVPR